MGHASKRAYEFGPFHLNPEERLLLRQGSPVSLTPKVFDTLVLLVQNRGHLLSKDDLMKQLWPDSFVEELNLSQNVSRLRKILGETEERRFITTVPGKGYRFTAHVREVSDGLDGLIIEHHAQSQVVISEEAEAERSRTNTEPRFVTQILGQPGFWLSALGVTGILMCLALASSFRPPRLLGATQITNDGRPKWQGYEGPLLLTDGSRIYTVEGEGRNFELVQAPVSGGETVSILTPFPGIQITDLDRERSQVLVLNWSGEAELKAPLWEYSLLSGSYARLGDLEVSDATWSPDGRSIFYTRGSELWAAKRDGTQPRLLATLPGPPGWPRASPDGRSVRFTLGDPKSASTVLWEISSDGRNPHELLAARNSPWRACCGTWTPDGRYFIFQSFRDGRWDIWALREKPRLASRYSRGPFPLTNGPIHYVGPAVSPDGTKLYVVGIQLRGEVMRYDSQKEQFIPYFGGVSADGLDFSRDGEWVTYVSFPEGQLWCSRLDGSERQQLSFAPMKAALPRWSPDGNQIAFMATVQGKPRKIYLVNAAGGAPRELLSEAVNESDPTWSFDGRFLTFGRAVWGMESTAAKPAIYTVDLSTQKLSMVPGSEGLFSPRWSSDGTYLAAISADSQRLMLYNPRTHEWRELVSGGVSYPRWSHDNRYIFFDTIEKDRFVNRVDIKTGNIEHVASLANLRTAGNLGLWSGLAPDDSILFLRNANTSEIYSFDLDLP